LLTILLETILELEERRSY
jgi:hypothetical protein